LCELVWVLSRSYRQPRSAIVSALDSILDTDSFQVEQEPLVRRSLAAYRVGSGSFPDYLIGEIGRHAGGRDTVTFDRALKDSGGFTLLA
jgi:predicted nucleic-acid-binding protein